MSVTVVIPTFNEAERIAATITEVAAFLRDRQLSGEIVVADDGSTDATRQQVETCNGLAVKVRLLGVPANRGKGHAVRRGVLAAAGDLVLFTDADLSTPIQEFERFLPLLQAGQPVVIGSRKLDPGRVLQRQPFYRQIMGRVFSWLARRLLHPGVSDFTCGFKAFRREVVPALFEPLTLDGWAFDAELLHIACRRGIPIREVAVTWSYRGDTRVRLYRDLLPSAAALAVVLWNGRRGRYDPQST